MSLGGNFSLLFGNTTFIDLSPQALYRFNSFFQAGPGITYMFLSDNIARYTAQIYGFRTIGRCYPIPWLFLHAEQEYLLGPWNGTDNSWLASTYAGVGYRNLIGQQGGLDVLALFNLRPSDLSPFTNPTFRVGFMFYLKP